MRVYIAYTNHSIDALSPSLVYVCLQIKKKMKKNI